MVGHPSALFKSCLRLALYALCVVGFFVGVIGPTARAALLVILKVGSLTGPESHGLHFTMNGFTKTCGVDDRSIQDLL